MDMRLRIQRWILDTVLILFLIHSSLSLLNGLANGRIHPCPQGQLLHHPNHKDGRPHITCCYPQHCGVGFEMNVCKKNGTYDTCRECTQYKNQSRRTSSFTMAVKCRTTDLNKDCTDKNGYLAVSDPDEQLQMCMCPPESGSKFKAPELLMGAPREAFCQSRKKCGPGMEPNPAVETGQDDCVECQDGYFKAKAGFEFCEPKRECAMLGLKLIFRNGSTGDNICSQPKIITTPKPVPPVIVPVEETGTAGLPKTRPVVSVTTEDKTDRPPHTTATAKSGSSRSVKETDGPEGESLLWPIILAIIFLLAVVIIIAVILFYRKRKGMNICYCGCCSPEDGEKYPVTGVNHGQFKNGTNNTVLAESHLMVVTKGVNNNIGNGGLPGQPHSNGNTTNARYPHAQQNGGSAVHFSEANNTNVENQMFQQQKRRLSPPGGRPGILRNGGGGDHHVAQAGRIPYSSRPQDASMDSIGREKLHANLNGFEANLDLGENDPLLVAEGNRPLVGPASSGGHHDLLHNAAYEASSNNNSPPLPIASYNPSPYHHPSHSHNNGPAAAAGNMNPNFSSSGSENPSPVPTQATSQQPTHQVTFAPTADTVSFKRSISVIASPEGEVEEEELEANVPRFSQILPDPEEASGAGDSTTTNPHLLRGKFHDNKDVMDSPQRETTNLMRLPYERLQHRPLQNPVNANNTGNSPHHHRANKKYPHHHPHHNHHGFPPALFRANSQPAPDNTNLPDHCIMDLKEQQLANSLSSSMEERSPSSAGLRAHSVDGSSHSSDSTSFKLEDFIGSLEQTDLKQPGANNTNNAPSAANNTTTTNNGAKNSKHPDFGVFNIGSGGGSSQNTLERKRSAGSNSSQRRRFLSGSNRQNSMERKRRNSGSDSAQNTLEPKKSSIVAGDGQRSCLKMEEGESEGKRLRLGRTVSFESEDDKNSDSIGHNTKPKQVGDSLSSTESGDCPYSDTAVDLRKVVEELGVADGEDINNGGSGGGGDTGDKDVNKPPTTSDTDLSSSEDGRNSPVGNSTYRRCQSESASSSTEGVQKPPPRSLSEEKPLKAERPIAKVKPMLASDNSVNKLVVTADGVTEDEEPSPPVTTTTTTGTGASNNILDYSSESSSGEENGVSQSQGQEDHGASEDGDGIE